MTVKIQPYIEMLIDALENKGASRSGISYNEEVLIYPDQYRELLNLVREKRISSHNMKQKLFDLRLLVLKAAGTNQAYRIERILDALDIYFNKEYEEVS